MHNNNHILEEFLEEWPLEKVEKISLEEYTNTDKTSFCYWVESKTNDLGSIWGGSSYKFGIFKRADTSKTETRDAYRSEGVYAWVRKYGETKEEAFEKIRTIIVDVIKSSKKKEFENISGLDLGTAYKWKIAFLYSEESLIPIYSKKMLRQVVENLGLTATNKFYELQKIILKQKPEDKNIFEYANQLLERIEESESSTSDEGKPADDQPTHNYQAKDSLNQILFGPPGTGKTYNTINKALEIIKGKEFVQINAVNREVLVSEFNRLKDAGLIEFITFHQSFSYEDFVEGIKPVLDSSPELSYEIKDGIFKQMCVNAMFNIFEKNEEQVITQSEYFEDLYEQFCNYIEEQTEESGNIEFTTIIKKWPLRIAGIDDNKNIILEHLKISGSDEWERSVKTPGKLKMLYDTYKNVNDISRMTDLKQLGIHSGYSGYAAVFKMLKDFEQTDYKKDTTRKELSYTQKKELIKGFNNFEKAGEPFVLVIDEINRGNISQIFGELITLMEEDKRLGNPERLTVTLPYSKETGFGVPPNLYIIGTMNTADRSIEALDTALRRRFSFEELPPVPALISAKGSSLAPDGMIDDVDVVKLLQTMNDRIEKLIDKDHKLGHSYFMKIEKTKEGLKQVFYDKIIPLLEEYFFGDFGKIGLVLGSSFVEKVNNTNGFDFADFPEYGDTRMDLIQREIYSIKPSEDWDFVSIYTKKQE